MPTQSELAHRVVQLERVLNLNDLTLKSIFHLTNACANLLGLLLAMDNVPVRLDGFDVGCRPRATVVRLRHQLKPWGFSVLVRRNVGYYLPPEDREQINRMLERERPGELALPMPGLSERDRACIRACAGFSFATLTDPETVLIAVPRSIAKGVRWLADNPPKRSAQ